ncbi:Putative phosphotransferase transport system, IIB component [Lacticaseibacillus paracasei subsp. paracasei Lpp125]|uniref:PTS sugar transporter subunit IIB n=1 Tax=Lacticaseibacillus paracasei TaxID=1597 RepID=UPI000343C680|nr:PTS sugar transporter subunit IIB [Lacticaseibacillus paracasei]EPD00441.1 Putative phosphotransferase transport system, IIB component [Lacticaseibacillus paracasei subsp. paracasei Lpp125]
MIKIVTVCGAGVGSSMMERLFAQQILDAEKIEAEVDASDISFVDPNAYDLVITTSDFANQLSESPTPIIRLDNLMDKAYLKSELLKHISGLDQSREVG